MTEQTQGAVPTDAEDTAAVLEIASGQKEYLPEKTEAEAIAAKPEPDAEDEDDTGEDTAAPTDAERAEKPKLTARERVQQAVARQREAERDRDFYREQALRGTQPQSTPAQVAQDTPPGDGRPDPADYADDYSYIEALTDWKAEQAVERLAERRSHSDRVRTTVESFETRAKTLYPDGEPAGLTAFKRIPELPVAVMEVVGASDIGPKLAEHLGDNPAELSRLERLSPSLQARELTLLENRLSAPPKLTPKTATDAPEPPPQARGSGGKFTVAADTNDFAAFEAQYRAGG